MPTSNDDRPAVSAATILLVRDQPAFEVLMVKRHHQIDFASGALVFPGGKTHAGDHDPLWRRRLVEGSAPPTEHTALRIAAIRETYEETGILLSAKTNEEACGGDMRAAEARTAVAKEQQSFLALVEMLDLRLDLSVLTVFARWITPAMMPKRFDTWFYIAHAPAAQAAVCDGWETVDAEWIQPAEALRLAAAGERKVIFPTRMNLQLLAQSTSAAEAIASARARPLVTVLPELVDSADGRLLVIPPDAGYGSVSELLARAL